MITPVGLTPLANGRSPAQLLGLRLGRNVEILHTWLQGCDPSFHSQVQVVTTDDFIGYASAVDQVLPNATEVIDPFHVVHLAADELTGCRQRPQRETVGQRGRKDDLLHKYRRALLIRTNYPTQWQEQRLGLLWAVDDDYAALEMTWLFYQDMTAMHRHPKESEGEKLMSRVINSLRKGLPAGLEELAQLGRIL